MSQFVRLFLHRFTNGNFLTAVAKLSGATVLGQVISVLASIILTRLYSPGDFGVLGVFTAIASQLTVFICMRYEWAILPAKEDQKAVDLLFLACMIAAVVTVLTTTAVVLAAEQIASWVKVPALAQFLWLMPITIFFAAIYQIFNYWAVRQKDFSVVAKSQVAKSLWSTSFQIGCGFLQWGALGLLTGFVVNQIGGVKPLLSVFWKNGKQYLAGYSFKRSLVAGQEYAKFAASCVASSFFNYAALSAPSILMAFYYDTEVVGFFSLAQRITSIPAVFISNSVSQVYFSHACELIHHDPRALKKLYIKTTLFLFGISLLAGFFLLAAPWIVPPVFGLKWKTSGIMTQYMAPMLLFTIAVSPLSMLEWLDKNLEILCWHLCRFSMVVAVFYLCNQYHLSSTNTVLAFSAITAIMYGILFLLNRWAIDELIKQHVQLD